ncbi:lysylphosphatidylglycerol synthase transmembrane domain-containing protein [Bacteriovorax sp. PP10]|uniref:Lysylphosphatidylglycerol synthase transmembrane domain-containing protein n=1 Tax=Bacteriovorax antarcticus TaxID=3088717 RepID=A0ABU5W0T6_9BACT|nr:lysylphosphatidylglycerol synthase transmembrane domain-containing protein [Bacteriovorax sp. PP10]MEA9358427.1 lysylphosphatidylglycerol synthase transmembrane domain-containing protein [Bacteriovorax sp. PP10]
MSSTKKTLYHVIILLLSASMLGGMGLYVYKNSSSFDRIQNIDISVILLLIGMHACNYFLLGLTQTYPLQRHNINLKFKEWYGLCTLADLLNYILPASGGSAARLLFINKKYDLSKRELVSMGLAMSMPGFILLGVVGAVYCHFLLSKHAVIFTALETMFIILTVVSLAFLFASNFIMKIFKMDRKYSPNKYLTDKKLMTVSTLSWLGMMLLHPLKVYLSFKAIGIEIKAFDSFEISLILLASSFFQVLPGNIGVKEMVTAYIAQQYGIQFETALLASLVDRAILMLFLFPMGAYSYWSLVMDASLPKINWPKMGASSRIPLMKRLVKVR